MAEFVFPPTTTAFGEGRREHFSPSVTSYVGPATAVTIINPNFPPCFFLRNPVVTLGVGRGILCPQSPIGWNMSCSLCWGKGEESQKCLGGCQWCVKSRMGHIHWERFRSSVKAHIRVCFWDWLFTLVFWCWWRLMQFPEMCAELLF